MTNSRNLIHELASYDRAKYRFLVDELCEKLKNAIIDITQLEPYEKAIKSACIKYNDNTIKTTDYMHDMDEQSLNLFIETCNQQEKLLRRFDEQKWRVPDISFRDVARLKENTLNRVKASNLKTKLTFADKQLTNTLKKAQAEYSNEYCEQASYELKQLKDLIDECKINSISISSIKNKDVKKVSQKINEIKNIIRAVEQCHKKIYETDQQIYALITSPTATDPISSHNIVSLCNLQKVDLYDCKAHSYHLPNKLKVNELDQTIAFYSKYTITERIKELDNKIDSELEAAKRTSDLKNCEQARAYLYQMQQLVYLGKNNGLAVQLTRNNEKTVSDCETTIKASIKKNEDIAAEINALYSELFTRVSDQDITHDKCQTIINTCDKLLPLVERFSAVEGNNLSISPEYINNLKEQFSLYPQMIDLNEELEIKPNRINNTGSINILLEKCKQQSDNFKTCIKRHWMIPSDFNDPKPLQEKLNERKQALQNKEANRKKLKSFLCKAIVVVVFASVAVFCVIKYVNKKNEEKNKDMVSIPIDLSETVNEDHESVKKQFEDAGFTSITETITDKGYYPSGSVVEVRVEGNTDYKKGTKVKKDTAVTITIASEERIDVTSVVNKWLSKETLSAAFDKNDMKKDFAEAGLDPGKVEIAHTFIFDKEKERMIDHVELGGINYESGKCYVDKQATVVYRTFISTIIVGTSAEDYIDKNYSSVVDELKEKGFTNIRLLRKNDLSTGWLEKEGAIDSISIDGDDDFSDDDYYYYDDEIIIIVHTFKKKGCEDITETVD